MKNYFLLRSGETEMVSRFFNGSATVIAFGLSPAQYETDSKGALSRFECGDFITFEMILTDEYYGIDCKGIDENGVLSSIVVLDSCGKPLTLTSCRPRIELKDKGIYRAVYHGDNRPDVSLIFHKHD